MQLNEQSPTYLFELKVMECRIRSLIALCAVLVCALSGSGVAAACCGACGASFSLNPFEVFNYNPFGLSTCHVLKANFDFESIQNDDFTVIILANEEVLLTFNETNTDVCIARANVLVPTGVGGKFIMRFICTNPSAQCKLRVVPGGSCHIALSPTGSPTWKPSAAPTQSPSPAPTTTPTSAPSPLPTPSPTRTVDPNASLGEDNDDGPSAAVTGTAITGSLLCCAALAFALFLFAQKRRAAAASTGGGSKAAQVGLHDTEQFGEEHRGVKFNSTDVPRGQPLGEGSLGVVYRGEWRGKQVAIKEIKSSTFTDKECSELIADASAMLNLSAHPNVVLFYGFSERPLKIITEFMAGGSLDKLVYSKKDIESAKLNCIALDAASGLAYLHEQGVVHRDVAARNILLDADWNAKVSDFGLARVKDDEEFYQQTKLTIGPVRWMAPEQMATPQYSAHADCYSFGVVLYEIYARERPWRGATNMQVIHNVMSGNRLAIPLAAPLHAQKVMKKLLAKKPKSRAPMRKVVSWMEKGNAQALEAERIQLALAAAAAAAAAAPTTGDNATKSSSSSSLAIPSSSSSGKAPQLPPSPRGSRSPRRRKANKKDKKVAEFTLSGPRNFVHAGGHSRGQLTPGGA